MSKTSEKLRGLTAGAMIAALYVALTLLSALFGLSGMGFLQLRLSEALCILPFFTAAAVPGLTVGCLLANLLTGAALPDILFGTLATLLGALGARLLRKHRFLAPLPTVFFNTLIMPLVICYVYVGVGESLPLLFLSVFCGEFLCAGILGILLLSGLEKYRYFLFAKE